ncbi:hypothetical protein JIM95_009270 [Corynebacterium sp. CCM 8835]|uniref:Uncharacterized protein n=1 Tax=Corynebacterium antarcticum TaxID=2800405 RepID=A0A9Q4GPV6_9CORY|nr:hypothetical protein [Corynebacterium antarcticum]MCK7643076.1 hypothetical protein [Corynebacterium antarcticum]MCK7661579.1 hypothetical protein [Corynebacterium antarcticum]MCL0246322.1 hypothetical protein [Corynebacterium antarcticum]MCX7493063.1 hypothetical protein [Corynebacterium antarcticum]MCX7539049.1 hypothetical protein [Corynebacterium antarcticum]
MNETQRRFFPGLRLSGWQALVISLAPIFWYAGAFGPFFSPDRTPSFSGLHLVFLVLAVVSAVFSGICVEMHFPHRGLRTPVLVTLVMLMLTAVSWSGFIDDALSRFIVNVVDAAVAIAVYIPVVRLRKKLPAAS